MKIVVLDGFTLNPGDLDWKGMQQLGETVIHEHSAAGEVVERAKGAGILFTNKTPVNEKMIAELPDLKYIGVLATGFNIVDVEAASKYGITVTNTPAYGTNSVAQMVFALLLELCHHTQHHIDSVKESWPKSRDFCYWHYPLIELAGKTIGIIGYGRIGQQAGVIAQAFGMKVLAKANHKSNKAESENFRWAELDEIYAHSDVISLHCPLTPETRGMINKDSLSRMKNSAFLINTSRGPLVVEEDLANCLNQQQIAGAGLDVLSVEPPVPDNPLVTARNCLVTPHIAWATKEARARLMDMAVNNLRLYLDGQPQNVVSKTK